MGVQLNEAGSFWGPEKQWLQVTSENELEAFFFLHCPQGGK